MRRRKDQLFQVKADFDDLTAAGKNVAEMDFRKLRTVLVNGFRVPGGVDPDRYTAMLKNYARGGTTDEDVVWHK
jgi:hypothetical protein